LSPNQTANRGADDADLQSLDVLFAICMHVLILVVILMLGLWKKPFEFHPQSVQVTMISAQQLDKLIKRARPPVQPPKPVVPPKPITPPKPAVKPAPEKPPVLKAPQAKPKPAAKAKPSQAADFDPFKPMESSTDVKSSAPRNNAQAADVFTGQLSEQEINHYIALIQDAVQRHWKVPTAGSDMQDPLVEMVLNPGGSVNRVKILESSGNAALDASLVRAIEAAAPFQVPTKQFELFRNNRIRFRPLR